MRRLSETVAAVVFDSRNFIKHGKALSLAVGSVKTSYATTKWEYDLVLDAAERRFIFDNLNNLRSKLIAAKE